ncbi:MAG: indole-3-glycerol phosphate synthase TrpC [Deltaproteobacteria bacterium]|nr:indole-3-glycerol phosphate synthase TrpC [Deltaproteobacteria bacterium]
MILDEIVRVKRSEVRRLRESNSLEAMRQAALDRPAPRNFEAAVSGVDCAVIAEVKRSSPSKGRIREDFDPLAIASLYEENGAAAISVLTDEIFFEGKKAYLSEIQKRVSVPILRKDFIIDPYQICETRIIGADAVLLIAAILEGAALEDFIELAESLGLASLVEVHSQEELERALDAGAEIIGINNRNLKTFSTDLATSLELAPLVPEGRVVISESGIEGRGDIERLMEWGIHTFLVGETLMRAPDIGAELRALLDT